MSSQTHLSRSLNGVETEVAILNYADRVLVLVTQLSKIGHMIQASIPSTVPLLPLTPTDDGLPLIEPHPSVELISIFGSAPSAHLTTLHSLYASHIATLVWTMTAQSEETGKRRDVIVGLAFKNSQDVSAHDTGLSSGEQTTFKGVMSMIVALLQGKDR
ncbi:hypothetical protein ACEPAG_739 [Sanghuangporus baumii]